MDTFFKGSQVRRWSPHPDSVAWLQHLPIGPIAWICTVVHFLDLDETYLKDRMDAQRLQHRGAVYT